jgi:hypothetical protein
MKGRRSNTIMLVGVAVFAVGALLALVGLRSGNRAVARPAPQSSPTLDPSVRTVQAGPAGIAGATTFSVPAGKQAVAVELPAVPGLAGYARPGDTVNLYATIANGQPNGRLRAPLVKLVQAGVQVLDVRAPAPGQQGTAIYLLALDPDQAEQVIFYAKFESLWIALATKDQRPPATGGRSYQNLL